MYITSKKFASVKIYFQNGEIKDVCHKGLPANEEEFLRRHGWGGGGGGGATFVFKVCIVYTLSAWLGRDILYV